MSTFEDARGQIADWAQQDDLAITRIHSVKGAVRGNHYHKETHQWTVILEGTTRVVSMKDGIKEDKIARKGDLVYHAPGEIHAFEALDYTEWFVFTKGPRAGDNYENDTFRLEIPLI